MEEINHLKIETATHIFPKFMLMQENVFDSCIHFFFCAHRRGAGGALDSLVESARWVEPGCRGGRPGLPLTIGSPRLPLYLPYIYIYYLRLQCRRSRCIVLCPLPHLHPDILPLCSAPHRALLTLQAAIPITRNPLRGRAGAAGGRP
jgi:hypothetical protein